MAFVLKLLEHEIAYEALRSVLELGLIILELEFNLRIDLNGLLGLLHKFHRT
jgi:hypothetical protein